MVRKGLKAVIQCKGLHPVGPEDGALAMQTHSRRKPVTAPRRRSPSG